MDEDIAVLVLQVDLVGGVGEKYDRVLQPLRVVDTDDLHGVAAFQRTGARLFAVLIQLLHPADEAEHAAIAVLLKLAGKLDELADVLAPRRAVGHRCEQGEDTGLVADAREQRLNGKVRRDLTVALQFREEGRAVFILLCAETERGVIVAVSVCGADGGELVRSEAEKRRAQHRDERHVLMGIVDHAEQREERGDLRGAEKPAALLGHGRDALFGERGTVARRDRLVRAEKDGKITVGARPQRLILSDGGALVHHAPDA